MTAYRQHIQDAAQKSQQDFDKTVLSLSGGALGISFVFLKDVVGGAPIVDHQYLLASWISWGCSSTAVLVSHFMSYLALRKTMSQIDAGTVRSQRPGGLYAAATAGLNATGALLFLAGVAFITMFAAANFSPKGATGAKTAITTPTAAVATTASSSAASEATAAASRR